MASAPLVRTASAREASDCGEGEASTAPVEEVRSGTPKRRLGGTRQGSGRAEPVVEAAARLPADGDGVFKAGGGDEGDACALALEHRVGTDGGAMANIVSLLRRGDLRDGFEYGAAWICGGGEELQDAEFTVFQIDAVGEGPAAVDGNPHANSLLRRRPVRSRCATLATIDPLGQRHGSDTPYVSFYGRRAGEQLRRVFLGFGEGAGAAERIVCGLAWLDAGQHGRDALLHGASGCPAGPPYVLRDRGHDHVADVDRGRGWRHLLWLRR